MSQKDLLFHLETGKLLRISLVNVVDDFVDAYCLGLADGHFDAKLK